MGDERSESFGVVVYGLDEQRRARAGKFPPEQATEACKQATVLNLVCKPLEGPKLVTSATTLPAGDLTKSGLEIVPPVSRAIYERLLSAVATSSQATGGPSKGRKPEAVGEGPAAPAPRPATWQDIAAGAFVLAQDDEATVGSDDGWFEAHVLEAAGDDQFKLRFRDYPEEGVVVRRRNQLALLPPA